ncbi:SDR family NAD(P)-dependent oxidoreductase [Sphingobium sp. TCM1]|uniref:SDR family NAD(P)-dependent oxidoreductase n=1 Tax=Sphingobium sp. TCM1 TaxID=453246 RepID=UPI0007F38080|nr:SDR family oxidoreductase [Sphingobium sp. TCM1]OAN56251.1 oxidoreductase [Sphingobium sp. TCM1]
MRIVITGASSGIGRAVVSELMAERQIAGPHKLLLVDRDRAGIESLVARHGPGVAAMVTDVGMTDCGDRIAAAAIAHMDGVDGLVSNAGFILAGSLSQIDPEAFDKAFAINTRATWLIAKALYPIMKEGGGGSMVATASMSAHHATPPLGAYAPSKAALHMIVKQLANEWGPDGIRVNSVSPGPTLTNMTSAGYADQQMRDARIAGIPTRRIGEPEDVAEAIIFLLSNRARQINGVDILVDGGLSTTLMTATGAGLGQGKK